MVFQEVPKYPRLTAGMKAVLEAKFGVDKMWDTDLTHSRNPASLLAIGRVVPNRPSAPLLPVPTFAT